MEKRIASLFLTLMLCMGLAAPAWADSAVTVKVDLEVDYSAAYEALEELNALRRAEGVGELVMDAAMMEMAVQRAAECTISLSHTRPNGQDFDTARPSGAAYEKQDMAENIHYSSGESDAASGSSLRCDFWKFHGKYPELPVSPAASVRFYHQSALTGDLRHSASGDSRYH